MSLHFITYCGHFLWGLNLKCISRLVKIIFFWFSYSLDLKNVPRAVSKVPALKRLDLSQNAIEDIYAYTFFGSAKLSYLNLESNRLTSLAENAFLGLENNLRELNLKDNAFDTFPLSAVKILKKGFIDFTPRRQFTPWILNFLLLNVVYLKLYISYS